MEKIIATRKWTSFDKDGNGHLFVEINGEELEIDTIIGATDMDYDQIKERTDLILKLNNIVIEEPKPVEKPKRKYTRHVKLGLASEYGKVTLTLAAPLVKYGYVLYLKGTNKFVYRFDERGIYVMDEDKAKKTKPMIWSENDIKLIKNIDDFDKKKVEVNTRPKNRLA